MQDALKSVSFLFMYPEISFKLYVSTNCLIFLGGYVLISMLVNSPKTLLVVFIKADGKPFSLKALFKGEVLEGSLFMDTKFGQVYIVYQIPQYAATVTNPSDKLKQYPYIILVTKANATGGLLTLGSTSTRHLVGYTSEMNAHLDGYFDEKNGWYVLC